MSLDKSINSGIEHHGTCDYCKGNRLYSTKKAMDEAKAKMKGE